MSRRTGVFWLSLACIIIVVWLFVPGSLDLERILSYGERISPSGQYKLVELQGDGHIIYMVLPTSISDSDEVEKIEYITPIWYPERYNVGACWANHTDDFFVISTDIGIEYYRYENDTWNNDTVLLCERDNYGNILPNTHRTYRKVDGEHVYEQYDDDNLPAILKNPSLRIWHDTLIERWFL